MKSPSQFALAKQSKIAELDTQIHRKADSFQQKMRRLIKAQILPDYASDAMQESKNVHAYSKSRSVTDARNKLAMIERIEKSFDRTFKRAQNEKAKTIRKLKRELKSVTRQPVKDLERHIRKGIDAEYQRKTLEKLNVAIQLGDKAKDEKDLAKAIKDARTIIKNNNITDSQINEVQQRKYPALFNVLDNKKLLFTDKQIKKFFEKYGKLRAIAVNDPNLSNYKSLSKAIAQTVGSTENKRGANNYNELMDAVKKAYDKERKELEFSPDEDEDWDSLIWSLGDE